MRSLYFILIAVSLIGCGNKKFELLQGARGGDIKRVCTMVFISPLKVVMKTESLKNIKLVIVNKNQIFQFEKQVFGEEFFFPEVSFYYGAVNVAGHAAAHVTVYEGSEKVREADVNIPFDGCHPITQTLTFNL